MSFINSLVLRSRQDWKIYAPLCGVVFYAFYFIFEIIANILVHRLIIGFLLLNLLLNRLFEWQLFGFL